jgi:hypothetical protein
MTGVTKKAENIARKGAEPFGESSAQDCRADVIGAWRPANEEAFRKSLC